MQAVREKVVETDANATHVVESQQMVPERAEVKEAKGFKASTIVWYVIGVVEAFLTLRVVLLLFGGRSVGFADFIYSITQPVVRWFQGIFSSPTSNGSYFDSAGILAMIVFFLVGCGITALIEVSTKPASKA